MLSIKIVFILFSVALVVADRDFVQLSKDDVAETFACSAHGQIITGQKTCILKCTMGCSTVGCGLFKKCEKLAVSMADSSARSVEPYASKYKCHCNFGYSALIYGL
ncbi:hypothetical protein HA402_003893 [Bradysia odoriphaga]|nr:hypothetical protein HA402_003893 [Bradysia odoriphaga]